MAGLTKVYSQRFCQLWNSGQPSTYVVPAGKRAVIMSVSAINGSATQAAAQVAITGVGIAAYALMPAAPAGVEVTNLRQVVNAGETISFTIGGTGGYGMVSGYLFDAV